NCIVDLTRSFSGSTRNWNRLSRTNLGAGHFSLPYPAATSSEIFYAFQNRVVKIRRVGFPEIARMPLACAFVYASSEARATMLPPALVCNRFLESRRGGQAGESCAHQL